VSHIDPPSTSIPSDSLSTSDNATVIQVSAPKASRVRRLVIILAIELPILAIVVGAVWLRMMPNGQDLWASLWDAPKIEAEQRAAANLRQRGVLVIAEPPDQHVTSVGFHGVAIDDELLAQVADLYRLMAINAGDSSLSDEQLHYFSNLSHLVSLVLSGTPITDAGLVHLRSLGTVEALHLSSTGVSDRGMADIACISGLKVLDLSGTKVTDEGLKPLTSLGDLKWLLLTGTEITDAGLAELAEMKGLGRLSISKTKATPQGVERLKQALPDLKVDL
jgi:hypothetical protein